MAVVLMKRTWLATLRDSSIMYVRTGAAVGIGLLVGVIFFGLADNETTNTDRINVFLARSFFCCCVLIILDAIMDGPQLVSGWSCSCVNPVNVFTIVVASPCHCYSHFPHLCPTL